MHFDLRAVAQTTGAFMVSFPSCPRHPSVHLVQLSATGA
jgi:hypothetical protein